ncbi:hypothetical protein B9G54_05845 [Alloscardovia macacae]|uniref:Uncharacterized protein n=1 Tax=Alloscardovia macacae TaxID=1160091 RepID=A0A1Y2SV93_9BIFI|nr:hypothetical protein [Alloscardovia macacae]OTA26086.1 hypothetical protein B9G54_05845 [Alloscardovia macacae]OTA29065.1 hypothetical protein B9T39_05280 [Alloscardovia macacae]
MRNIALFFTRPRTWACISALAGWLILGIVRSQAQMFELASLSPEMRAYWSKMVILVPFFLTTLIACICAMTDTRVRAGVRVGFSVGLVLQYLALLSLLLYTGSSQIPIVEVGLFLLGGCVAFLLGIVMLCQK